MYKIVIKDTLSCVEVGVKYADTINEVIKVKSMVLQGIHYAEVEKITKSQFFGEILCHRIERALNDRDNYIAKVVFCYRKGKKLFIDIKADNNFAHECGLDKENNIYFYTFCVNRRTGKISRV